MDGMRKWVGTFAVFIVVVAGFGGTANAQECGTLGNAKDFDAFIQGDYDVGNTQVQGRVAVGGNARIATGGGYAVGTQLSPSSGRVDLLVGGTLTVGGAGAQAPNGSVTYGRAPLNGAITTPNGTTSQRDPPFSFATSFSDLAQTSQQLGDLAVNGSQTITPWYALTFTSTNTKRAVFSISAADLQQAQQVIFSVPASATVIVNVTGQAFSSATRPMTSMSGIDPTRLLWNFQLATRVQIGPSIQWLGSILAPQAAITFTNGQLLGQVVGASYSGDGTIIHTPFGGCLPVAPTHDLLAAALCRNPLSDATSVRITNTATHAIRVTWTDADSAQGDTITLPARTDTYIDVQDGRTAHHLTISSSSESVRVTTATRACTGTILVSKVVTGDGTPPSGPWQVVVTGDSGNRYVANVNAGQTVSFDVPGDYEPGTAGIGEVVGGFRYTVEEPDPRGAVATVTQSPVTIFDGTEEPVVVGNNYTSTPGGGGGGTEGGGGSEGGQGGGGEEVDPPLPGPGDEVIQPSQPTLPPGAPAPAPGPGLVAGASTDAADLAVTQKVSPARTRVGRVELSTTVIRNIGTRAANAVVVRELPQADPNHPNRIVRLVSVRASGRFACNGRRPVSCQLGTLQPGARVTVVAEGEMLRTGSYKSVVTVSSPTPESNLTNNTGMDGVVVGAAPLRVTVRSPRSVHTGDRVSYRVSVRAPAGGVDAVRLCHTPTRGLLVSSAPGTRRSGRRICLDISHLASGATRAFTVHAVASAQYAGRSVLLPAAAAAPGLARAARGASRTAIVAEEPSGLG
jgi:choice-of-anchor A domain-containing protein